MKRKQWGLYTIAMTLSTPLSWGLIIGGVDAVVRNTSRGGPQGGGRAR